MIKKVLTILSLVAVFVFLVVGVFFYWGFYIEKDAQEEERFFVIRPGEGFIDIAKRLEEEGIIKKDYFFLIYGEITGKGRGVIPGNYILSPSMSVSDIVKELSSGKNGRITIVEGWNLRDVANFLEEEGYGTKEEFYRVVGSPPSYEDGEIRNAKPGGIDWELNILKDKPKELPLEGYLFPETYFISPGTPMEDIVYSFLFVFKEKITPEIKEKIKEKETSLFEIITIASLIEKEVVSFEDKRLVSGIIQRRMEEGMRLQVDATISYLTGRRSVRIPITETRIDSPYNTYAYSGLPPGPICNPGIESIKAALSPQESDYLYYLSRPDGKTVFNETHEGHVEAKNKYLR